MLRRHPADRHPIRRRTALPATRRPGLATRLRWSCHRHPWRWWLAVSVLALGAAAATDAHLGPAERSCPAPESGPTAVAEAAGGTAAERLPAGTRGVAVPAPPGLALAAGDQVDVLATAPAEVEGTDPAGPAAVAEVVARGAPVVAVDEAAVTVAVAADEAAVVAEAATRAATTLVLTAG